MTLLVLDTRAPQMSAIHTELQLWQALVALAPRFLMYAMSFLNHLARADRDLAWIHIGSKLALPLRLWSPSIITNNTALPALSICALYKARWQVGVSR
jgi:hypothetical protein